jgi:hypothetical protein
VLLAHLLAAVGDRHLVHKNECEGHAYFFAQRIVMKIIIKVAKYTRGNEKSKGNLFLLEKYK